MNLFRLSYNIQSFSRILQFKSLYKKLFYTSLIYLTIIEKKFINTS
jgi:hypothetical protein